VRTGRPTLLRREKTWDSRGLPCPHRPFFMLGGEISSLRVCRFKISHENCGLNLHIFFSNVESFWDFLFLRWKLLPKKLQESISFFRQRADRAQITTISHAVEQFIRRVRLVDAKFKSPLHYFLASRFLNPRSLQVTKNSF
jgi:hypothetical protein